MNSPHRKTIAIDLAIIVAFAFCAVLPSLVLGIPTGPDMPQHYQSAATVYQSLASGKVYSGFSGSVNEGFGDVGLRFYPPLAYYFLSGSYILAGDWYYASVTAFFLVFFAGGLGVYLWAREQFAARTALIAAAIYTFAPYHLSQLFNSFLFADFLATSITPFCLYFVVRIRNRGNTTDVCGLAASVALLILTNLPQTVIGALTLAIYSILLLDRKAPLKNIFKLAIAVLLGLAASSFYWVRMVTELSWVHLGTNEYFSGDWSYRSNFLFSISDIVNFQNDLRGLWLLDLMLISAAAVSVLSVIYLVRNRQDQNVWTMSIAVTFAVALFMATPLSTFIWDSLSIIQKVQFPWRWLSIATIFGSVFASTGIDRLFTEPENSKGQLKQLVFAVAILIFTFTSAFALKGAVYRSPDEFRRENASAATRPGCKCFWPIWARPEALKQKETVIADQREVQLGDWLPESRSFEVEPGSPTSAVIATFWYPHWKATVNGLAANVQPDSRGLIAISLPAERSHIALYFDEPPLARTAGYVSLFAAIALLIAVLAVFLFKQNSRLPLLN